MKLDTIIKIIRRPAVAAILVRDIFKIHNKVGSDRQHLDAAMQWLCRAQDATGCGGVSSGWSVKNSWLPPYPETTGYIIPTFLKYASVAGDGAFFERAIRMGNWELGIQFSTGAFPSSAGTGGRELVFDTGQVIQGLTALFIATKDGKWLEAAVRAGKWIVSVQEKDGSWINGSHKNIPHAYYTRVAWPLLELSDLTNMEEFRMAAESHLRWVLSLRHPNAWIDQMGFFSDADPLTHTLAYTYEGLLECSGYLNSSLRSEVTETVENALNNILNKQQINFQGRKALPAYVNNNWQFYGPFSCLVGNAQLALIYLRMYEICGSSVYWDFSTGIVDQLKSVQVMYNMDSDMYGALSGAWPVWEGYGSLSFINWAVKFLVDALLLKALLAKNIARNKL